MGDLLSPARENLATLRPAVVPTRSGTKEYSLTDYLSELAPNGALSEARRAKASHGAEKERHLPAETRVALAFRLTGGRIR
jgi:hypothetical protein